MNEHGRLLDCKSFKKGNKVMSCKPSKKQPGESGQPRTTNGIIHARHLATEGDRKETNGLEKRKVYCWQSKPTDPCTYMNELGRLLDCKIKTKPVPWMSCKLSKEQPVGAGQPGTTNGTIHARRVRFAQIEPETTAEGSSDLIIRMPYRSTVEITPDGGQSSAGDVGNGCSPRRPCLAQPAGGVHEYCHGEGHKNCAYTNNAGQTIDCEYISGKRACDPKPLSKKAVISDGANHDAVEPSRESKLKEREGITKRDAHDLRNIEKRIVSCTHSKTSWLCLVVWTVNESVVKRL